MAHSKPYLIVRATARAATFLVLSSPLWVAVGVTVYLYLYV